MPESLPVAEIEYAKATGKCIMGGLDRRDITDRNFDKIRFQIQECLKTFEKKKHILAPGCVIRYPLDQKVLSYIKKTSDELQAA